MEQFDLNPKFKEALELMESSTLPLFITGRAGTGKSTLLRHFRENSKKKVAVVAPTGVAAVNVRGETIHSFLKIKPGTTPDQIDKVFFFDDGENIYKAIDTLIIDEVSMVRADLMDCIDRSLRINRGKRELPFGGVQVVMFGDLFQLPPVINREEREQFKQFYKSEYFFDADVFNEVALDQVELDHVYRQSDEGFLNILNGIRTNKLSMLLLKELNQRFDPDFIPELDSGYVYIATTNALVDKVNAYQLEKLSGELFRSHAQLEGDFNPSSVLAEQVLELKIGAQVMLLNNDKSGRWVNGTIGIITGISQRNDIPVITLKLEDGEYVEVEKFKWEQFRYSLDETSGKLIEKSVGSFEQYPLKLAWAVTVHKSQGKTFEKVIVDMGRGAFAHGQLYVALSRCRTLEGVILKNPVKYRDLIVDPRVIEWSSLGTAPI